MQVMQQPLQTCVVQTADSKDEGHLSHTQSPDSEGQQVTCLSSRHMVPHDAIYSMQSYSTVQSAY